MTSFPLLMSGSASLPFLYLTDENLPSPQTAPAFTMLLRKHIGSGRLIAVTQPGLERVLDFLFEAPAFGVFVRECHGHAIFADPDRLHPVVQKDAFHRTDCSSVLLDLDDDGVKERGALSSAEVAEIQVSIYGDTLCFIRVDEGDPVEGGRKDRGYLANCEGRMTGQVGGGLRVL